jgi:hypothetical protein
MVATLVNRAITPARDIRRVYFADKKSARYIKPVARVAPVLYSRPMQKIEVTYAEIDAALTAIGGLAGLPVLISSVASMLPGASMPGAWSEWLTERCEAREPLTLSLTSSGSSWTVNIK